MKTINDYTKEFSEAVDDFLRSLAIYIDEEENSDIGYSSYSREKLENHYRKALTEALESVRLTERYVPGRHEGESFCPQCEDNGHNAAKAEVDRRINEILEL